MLVVAVVSAIIIALMALSTAKINQAAFNGLTSSKTALQAQQYAAAKAEIINSIKYDELAAQARDPIPNTNYSDEVIIGAEEPYPNNPDIMQKVCRINVYAAADVLPRYSLQVIRTSVPQGSSLPAGSIIPWYGNLADIPDGFALCNGSNGTPDLRDKFITGAGSTYALGDTGGQYNIILTKANLPKDAATSISGSIITSFKAGYSYKGQYSWSNSTSGGKDANWCMDLGNFSATIFSGWNSTPIENRPPYYALYYIMKLE